MTTKSHTESTLAGAATVSVVMPSTAKNTISPSSMAASVRMCRSRVSVTRRTISARASMQKRTRPTTPPSTRTLTNALWPPPSPISSRKSPRVDDRPFPKKGSVSKARRANVHRSVRALRVSSCSTVSPRVANPTSRSVKASPATMAAGTAIIRNITRPRVPRASQHITASPARQPPAAPLVPVPMRAATRIAAATR